MSWWSWLGRLVELPFSAPQHRLMRERNDYGKDDFIRSFSVDAQISNAVWDGLSREAVVKGFKPMPTDDLQRVFGLAEEDLDDFVLQILVQCGCRIPDSAETSAMSPVRTVGDLVAFVAGMRNSGT